MNRHLCLVHWDAASAQQLAHELNARDWQVDIESADGGHAYQRAKAHPPDVVMIDLSHKPSHGRRTAAALRDHKATEGLPIVFVDGTAGAIEKARTAVPDAVFTTSAEVQITLATLTSSTRGTWHLAIPGIDPRATTSGS